MLQPSQTVLILLVHVFLPVRPCFIRLHNSSLSKTRIRIAVIIHKVCVLTEGSPCLYLLWAVNVINCVVLMGLSVCPSSLENTLIHSVILDVERQIY